MPELFFLRMQQPAMSDLEVTKSIQQEHEMKASPLGIMAVLSERFRPGAGAGRGNQRLP